MAAGGPSAMPAAIPSAMQNIPGRVIRMSSIVQPALERGDQSLSAVS
jgi:hypothetical protein